MPGPGAYFFGEEERKELLDVMETGYLSRYGSEDDPRFKHKVVTFEKELAKYVGSQHAIAVSGGTSALIASLAALGIGPGDEVIVPGYTFIASISSIIHAKAIPILAEIDESLNIDPEDIRKKITKKTKAIMPVDMLGNPCDMDSVMEIAKEFGLYVVEDSAQALGATYRGKKLGTIGDIGAFSLNVNKIISTGDAGAIVTNDDKLYERAFGFHDQGHKPYRMGLEIGHRNLIGMNLRINELTGAVALAQLKKIDRIISMLRDKKRKLKNAILGNKKLGFRKINDEGEIATILTLLFKDKETADKIADELGTKTLAHSGWHVYNNMEQILNKKTVTEYQCPFVCERYGQEVKYYKHMLPKTDEILGRAINISIGVVDPGIGAGFGITVLSDDKEIEQVADKINAVLKIL